MGPRQLWIWLTVTAAMTVMSMVIGAATANQSLVVISALLYTAVAVIASWRFAAQVETDVARVSARFARLIALTWGWAGTAMLSCYYLTGLSWQHAWQYGLAMLLIAAGIAWFAGQRENREPLVSSRAALQAVRSVTMLQALAAITGVLLLAMSDKLQPEGRDWAANIVFVAGGLVIFAQSTAALRAERRALRESNKS